MGQGYRTIIFNGVLMVCGVAGAQFSGMTPEAQHWVTLGAVVWGIGGFLLRMATSTPIGQKIVTAEESRLEAALGLSDDDVQKVAAAVTAALPAQPPVTDLQSAMTELTGAVKTAIGSAPGGAPPASVVLNVGKGS